MRISLILLFILFSFSTCKKDGTSNGENGEMELITLRVGGYNLLTEDVTKVPAFDKIFFTFSCRADTVDIKNKIEIQQEGALLPYSIQTFDSNQTVAVVFSSPLQEGQDFRIIISEPIKGDCGTFQGIEQEFTTLVTAIELVSVSAGDIEADLRMGAFRGLDVRPEIEISFSSPVSLDVFSRNVSFVGSGPAAVFSVQKVDAFTFNLIFNRDLEGFTRYELYISPNLISEGGAPFEGASIEVYTDGDTSYKFPQISDEELLTKVQEYTFKYFWDFAHPVSGLIRERNTSGDLVTIGGSGFGVMSIIVGIERGFITRSEGIQRLTKIVNFLGNQADRFHGVWSHWLNGVSGGVIPFSSDDDGGDLVETAFMVQGLYTVRQYLNESVTEENSLINKINNLIDGVEWDWYTQGGQNVLYWHWSPNFGWQKNMRISGWNEALIIYVLAASSTTHTIDKAVYTNGWARNGAIRNTGNQYFGYELPLRSDMGGPLFFAHYSFLGLDPRNLTDLYANYWNQNVIHTKINRAYCVANPKNYPGYSERSWGLTASDGNNGYSAHSPNNDRGVITPTAAISSIPYTPEESMEAIRFFYYILGDKLWGPYGFYDAYNINAQWFASSYLAIDQGPIICMIENYRTGKLWELFMSAPEIQNGLTKLGFSY
ncbi:MAG: glucoamylase family protein [Bacteroidales bacterium]